MAAKPNPTQLNNYAYDPSSLRYRHTGSGRFVPAKQVRAAVDTVIDTETQRIRAISQSLVNGEINLAEWQLQTSTLIKHLHVSMGLAANGGLANTSASDMGYIASEIKGQYKYLRDFALQIKRGTQKLDGSLVARSALYVQAARGVFEDTVRRANKNAGNLLERRNLGAADHCQGADGCVALAALGWQPIGTLPSIGDTPCMSNCKCSFSYGA